MTNIEYFKVKILETTDIARNKKLMLSKYIKKMKIGFLQFERFLKRDLQKNFETEVLIFVIEYIINIEYINKDFHLS